jgi:uncharacterized protein
MNNPFFQRFSPTAVFFLFMGLAIMGMSLGAVLSQFFCSSLYGINSSTLNEIIKNPDAKNASVIKFVNTIFQIFAFVLPSLLAWYFFGKRMLHRLMFATPNWIFWIAPLFLLAANPLIGWSSQLNGLIFPEDSSLGKYMVTMEQAASKMALTVAHADSPLAWFTAILTIALVPAFAEELTFRGVLQPIISKMAKNIHVGVWVTAIIFSAFHGQFLTFLPRVILGGILGYLVIWSGSIWTSIFAHFMNNLIALMALNYTGTLDPQIASGSLHWVSVIISLTALMALCVYAKKKSNPYFNNNEYIKVTDFSEKEGHAPYRDLLES